MDFVQTKYWVSVWIISILSFIFSIFLSTAEPSADFGAHLNWMRITHRLSLKNWYDHDGDYKLDYPPLEAYIHYLMGFIYKLVDPYTLDNTALHTYNEPIWKIKYGVRIPILIQAVIFYYPAVIYFVTNYYKSHANSIKLLLIAALLNMPLFTQIEHMNTQVNAPTLGFLIWSIYFMLKDKYSLCAFFFTLSVMCKQITLPSLFPIAFYIVGGLYKDACEKLKSKQISNKYVYLFLCSLKLVFIGIMTIMIIMIPFWDKPNTIREMLARLFPVGGRTLLNPASTFWTFFNFIFIKYDVPEYRALLFRICSAIVMLGIFCTAPFIIKKPKNGKVFFAAYAVCGVGMYMFGYYMHEKHLQYGYYGILLGFEVFKEILTSFSGLASFTLFYMAGINKNLFEYSILTTIFLFITNLLANHTPAEQSKNYEIIKSNEDEKTQSDELKFKPEEPKQQNLKEKLANYFSKSVYLFIAMFLLLGIISIFVPAVREFVEKNSVVILFNGSFPLMAFAYIYLWNCLYKESKNETKIE